MNVPTITVPREEAQRKLKAYRANMHRDAEDIYRRTAAAYEAAAQGKTILFLSQAMLAAGFGPDGRPRIAICRADREEVKFWRERWEPLAHFQAGPFDHNGNQGWQAQKSHTLRIGMSTAAWPPPEKYSVHGFALVPVIPANVRPATGQLKDWHVLWEVEQWADRPQKAQPPRDPLLLEHIDGDLWSVLAEWNLTEIERAVMAGGR